MKISGHLTLLGLLVQGCPHVDAVPPECDPDFILLQDEVSCLELLRPNSSSSSSRSPAEPECVGWWDLIHCWPHAAVGDVVSQPCPSFLHSSGRVFRNCTEHGWTEPYPPHHVACEYGSNQSLPQEVFWSQRYFLCVRVMYTAGYATSLASLTVAAAVLCLFRGLHCTRNFIHVQLFLSFILRAALIFIRDLVLFSTEDYFRCGVYPVSCKVATSLSNYCILANYSWFLAEAHFLYSLVSASPRRHRRRVWWYVLLGWGSPVVIISGWSSARYLHEDEGCWETRRSEWIWWILRVPALVFITVNLVFFSCIIRVLVEKLRTQELPGTEFSQYRKLAKSSFLLVSLFGLHYVVFAFRPHQDGDGASEVWNLVELAFASIQGFVVALLYCFLNGEVQNEVRRRWQRWRMTLQLENRNRNRNRNQGGAATNISLLIRTASTAESGRA